MDSPDRRDRQYGGTDTYLRGYLVHEIGHYWQGGNFQSGGTSYWGRFVEISNGRTTNPNNAQYTFSNNEGRGGRWYLNTSVRQHLRQDERERGLRRDVRRLLHPAGRVDVLQRGRGGRHPRQDRCLLRLGGPPVTRMEAGAGRRATGGPFVVRPGKSGRLLASAAARPRRLGALPSPAPPVHSPGGRHEPPPVAQQYVRSRRRAGQNRTHCLLATAARTPVVVWVEEYRRSEPSSRSHLA